MFITKEVVQSSLQELGLSLNVNIDKTIQKFKKGDINNSVRIMSKNNILLFLMESQKIPFSFNIDVKNKCECCGGRGFNVFLYETIFVKCKLEIINQNGKTIYYGCNGTGKKISKCLKCNGTAKIGETPCPTCFDPKTKQSRGTFIHWKTKDSNLENAKCLKCLGTGQIKKLVPRETNIKNVEICGKCHGSGINTNIGTPVIPSDTAKILQSLCK